MSRDKYGSSEDPYCYPGTPILRNLLKLQDDEALSLIEQTLSSIAASEIDFAPPPYGLKYLQALHRHLFKDVYTWAGALRSIDISKAHTRFCTVQRIEPEAKKLFDALSTANWLVGQERSELVVSTAQYYGDLNMLHPFRDGNGRAQRVLFEHLIFNAGYEVSWWAVEQSEWVQANIQAVSCDYSALEHIFERCIGQPLLP